MKIEVLISNWNGLAGGIHEIEKPSRELLSHAAAAEAAGIIKVTADSETRAKLGKHIESQAESEKVYERAQETGAWHEGQAIQAELDAKNPDAPKVSV